MRDGPSCSIRLLRAYTAGQVLLYELEIIAHGNRMLLPLRYSALRYAATLLPRVSFNLTQTEVPFPEPQHLNSLLSQLTGNSFFLQERQRQLTHYLEAISAIGDLQTNQGFTMLVSQAISFSHPVGQEAELWEDGEPPAAPKMVGRKLSPRVIEECWS